MQLLSSSRQQLAVRQQQRRTTSTNTSLAVPHNSRPCHHRRPSEQQCRVTKEEAEQVAAADKALEAMALEAGLADLARQALSADPTAAAQLKRYEAAVVRLEKAKAAEKELEVIMKVSWAWVGVGAPSCPPATEILARLQQKFWRCQGVSVCTRTTRMLCQLPHTIHTHTPPGRAGGCSRAGRRGRRQRAPAR
jgi:hypothetical protein